MKRLACLLLCMGAQLGHALPFNGLYVTGGAGGTTASIQNDQLIIGNLGSGNVAIELPSESTLYADSFSALMEIGYSHQFHNHLVLAGSLTANYENIQFKNATIGGVHPHDSNLPLSEVFTISLSNEFAVLLKPGYVLGKNTLFYGLIGPRWGNFTTSTMMVFGIPVGGGVVADFSSSDVTQGYEIGLTLGAGIKQAINEHLDLGLEYAYTTYGEITSPNAFLSNNLGGGMIISGEATHELQAYTNTLMFTLTYRP